MGIGEPLDNFDEVMRFLENISSPEGVNIGMRNISLSTCGLVPKIDQLAEKKLQLTLSVSLHAPNNDIRSGMMPVNDAYPVEVLMQAVRRYQETTTSTCSWIGHPVSGLRHATIALFRLAFASAPNLQFLTLLHNVTRRSVLQKVRDRALLALSLLVNTGFQVLFHSPPGVLFTFPSRYYALSVTNSYLGLGGGPPGFPPDFSCPAVLWCQLVV